MVAARRKFFRVCNEIWRAMCCGYSISWVCVYMCVCVCFGGGFLVQAKCNGNVRLFKHCWVRIIFPRAVAAVAALLVAAAAVTAAAAAVGAAIAGAAATSAFVAAVVAAVEVDVAVVQALVPFALPAPVP